MTDQEIMEQGEKAAYLNMMRTCCRELGYREDVDVTGAQLIIERTVVIQVLRGICADFGDNDWADNLNMSDIINKHLYRNLDCKEDKYQWLVKQVSNGNFNQAEVIKAARELISNK